MRVSDGARKINRHGGAIFIHDDWHEEKGIDVSVVTDIPQAPIAPIEIRDFVYCRLIEIRTSTQSEKQKRFAKTVTVLAR